MDAKRILYDIYYVPVMYRWGCDNGHAYIMGIFDNKEKAVTVAMEEREHRGGKYEWVVEAYALNKDKHDSWTTSKIRRVAKSSEMNTLLDGEPFPDENDYYKKYLNSYGKMEREKMENDIKYHEERINELRKRLQEEI